MSKHTVLSSTKTNKSRFFYGYIVVLASFLVVMIVYGAQYSFGVFFKPVLNEFCWTRAATSGAYSLYMILHGFLGVIAGRLNDRLGPRLLVTVCGLFLGLGYLLMSLIGAIWHIYLFYGVFLSIGAAGIWVPLISTVARWFVKGRGLVSGIVASGIGVGTIIMPPLANQLISSYSWRTSYIIVGLIALVVTVIAAQFLRRDPSQVGQLAYGGDAAKTENPNMAVKEFSIGESILTRQFWIISIIFFLLGFCVQTVMVHLVPHATDIGVSADVAATILSIIGWVSIMGKIGLASAGDRLGNKRIMVIVLILASVAFLLLQLASGLWILYLFAAVFALGYGGEVAVRSPIMADFFGLRAHGAILGLVSLASCLGGAIGPLVAGRIFDISGSYYWAFVLCTAFSIVGLILVMLLKPTRREGLV